MGNTSSPLAPLSRLLGRRLAAERAELRFAVAELAELASVSQEDLEAAEAGHLPISSMIWVWAWTGLTQARRVFAGHEELPRPRRRQSARKPQAVAAPAAPAPAVVLAGDELVQVAPELVHPEPEVEPAQDGAPPRSVDEQAPSAPLPLPAPASVFEDLVGEATSRSEPTALPLGVVLRPQLSEAPLEPSIRPNGRCLHGMVARWCAPCLGVERRGLPSVEEEEPRRRQRYLGPLKPDVRTDLRDNYRPKRSVLGATWGPTKENNRGAANARKNADGKVHQTRQARQDGGAA